MTRDKLTPHRVRQLASDIDSLRGVDALMEKLNVKRTDDQQATELGEAIRRHLGANLMHDAPANADLGRAALDGIIASIAMKRAEIQGRVSPFVELPA